MLTTEHKGNAPAGEPPQLREWLRQAAAVTPNAIALDGVGGPMSYAALAAAVGDSSVRLMAAGLVPGDRVAIAAARSQETILSILACVDAGVGYVPLDLSYPGERLRAMLETSKPRVVLGEAQALAELRRDVGDIPTLEHPAPPVPAFGAEPDLTYVLFTSGSTGRPKGVAMGALPLRHLIAWHARHPRLGQPARTLQFAPLSFDVHCQEIFTTMACGGTLVVVAEAERRDPARLRAAIAREHIERLFLPYVALQMLAEASRNEAPSCVREVISAGEQLQITPAIRAFFAQLPGAELHNQYGPTETHVVTAHELRGLTADWPEIPPIGVALPHVHVALLDAKLDGSGVTGELLLGGQTLAHGYLDRADLSRERFRDDIAAHPGRWYATGDLVRRGSDGALTYLGRVDDQVKVDGFRIEPGEIELALMSHPLVSEAVVTAPEVPGAGRQLVAHVVLREALAQLPTALREHLRTRIPDYMLPARYVPLDRLPTTPSGKIDRRVLPLPVSDVADRGDSIATARSVWQQLLGLDHIADDQNLFDLGARSLLVLRFVARMGELGITTIGVADVYDQPTLGGLASTLLGQEPKRRGTSRTPASATSGIAIVGMAARAGSAADVEELWSQLLNGEESLRRFSADELDPSIPTELRSRTNFVAARGVLEGAERFDAAFFGIAKREAVLLDPQQRLLLELSWTALEHAGIDPAQGNDRIGVYAGTANNSYISALREEQPELIRQAGEFAAMLASEKDYVATRIAHRLDLNGPAVSIHTACSTGLVAVAQAWHALASGQCDVALAGGATVVVPQHGGYLHVEGGMESADGRCRPFDAQASGTVFGSGGAVVVLKRVEDAIAAGDTIHAVIRGVGLNNDGSDKASFTAPSVRGQAGAIRAALEHAGVPARSVGYVEAHGTATALGDPIEVAALTEAWREETSDTQFCLIGSVKSNLGHTIAAAGVFGLIKAVLAMQRHVIPATLHYQSPNPHIDFAATPFRVVQGNTPWPRGEQPRRAGVSSFGVGGTNAHVIVEEAPTAPASTAAPSDGQAWILPISARSTEAALSRAAELATHLERHGDIDLPSVAATLMRGRQAMPYRAAVVAGGTAEAVKLLREVRGPVSTTGPARVVFLFSGQGSQHPGMAKGLYERSVAFREALDRCIDLLRQHLDVDWHLWLVHADPHDTVVADTLAKTCHAQPALFAMSYSLAAWLESLGIRPAAMIGHSVGEYAAACQAGVFSLEHAIAAVVARGASMFAQPPGAMLAVRADVPTTSSLMSAGIEVASCNAEALTVVAGSGAAIDAMAMVLDASEIGYTRLKVSHAFHSASMDGALPEVERALRAARPAPPTLPVYSCVSGALLTAAEATDPTYWSRQVRAPVQFSRAIQAELAHADTVFLEVGPGQALTALVRQHRNASSQVPRVIALLGPAADPGDAGLHALRAIGAAWCAGVPVRWPVPAGTRRATLPGYPFRGEVHWFARRPTAVGGLATPIRPSQPDPGSAPFPATEVPVAMSRIPRLEHELAELMSSVSGIAVADMSPQARFVELGLDSLSLTQATLEIERVFGLKLRFRRLLEDLDSLSALATHLDVALPADVAPVASTTVTTMPAGPSAGTAVAVPAATAASANSDYVRQVVQQQMQLMAQQLALLGGQPVAASPAAAVASPAPVVPPAPTNAAPEPTRISDRALIDKPFGASARITLDGKAEFTVAQRDWLRQFIARYNERTAKSKSFSQQHRRRMADPRVVTGFDTRWKDLVYPIVADRSEGARVWDLDGNAYIDLLSCFGGNLLGYRPPELTNALIAQLRTGIEVGPQHPLAAEVADLIAEFTGMERVAFCNTGSEAVMGAMRVARTVTGRKTIAIFTNSYHGIFDEVIVRGTKQLKSLSAAPGILANAVENVLVLDWASEDSLRILRERGSELAAIMTEPIQNKVPTLQPRAFVQSLREIADRAGCALIFDEVVTGFRVAPGGAQEFYGVRADLATYGKVIGGGLPFAAIAGSARWMDALDGGHWSYGDDSYPEAGVTYFAGTFVRHPLALAAARASLLHLKRGGREFYRELNSRTQGLVDRLNAAFAVRGAPVKAVHCASLWRLAWDDGQKHVSLFYYLARHHGLHLYEQFGHFVTAAMGQAEIDRIYAVFTEALDELMTLGFITPRAGALPTLPRTEAASTSAPLAPGQVERWLAASLDRHARIALNESLCLTLEGPVDLTALESAANDVLLRHEAFRLRFDTFEPRQVLDAGVNPRAKLVDLRGSTDADAALDRFCEQASRREFALDVAPLAELSLVQLADGRLVVHLVASHLVFDGWASSVFNAELAIAYTARRMGMLPQLEAAESPLEFAEREQARFEGPEGQDALRFWQEQLRNPPAQLNLGDRVPPNPRRYAADTLRVRLDGELFARLRAHARQSGATLFQLLLTAVTMMLQRRSGQAEFVVSIPYASQSLQRHGPLMGDGVLDLPIRLCCGADEPAAVVLQRVRSRLMDALEHPLMTQGTVARALGIRSAGDRPPLTGIYFNLNPRVDLSGYAPLVATMHEGRKAGTLSELFFNFYEQGDALTLDLHYSSEFYSPARAQEITDALMLQCRSFADATESVMPAVPQPQPEVSPPVPLAAAIDQRLVDWNARTAMPLEPHARVEQWISRQAAASPEAVALIANGVTLTYRAIESRANRFANLLKLRGIGAGTRVGVCLDRGPDLVPALLGVLKTGAAYVPLDPGFPKDRLHYMAEDAGISLVITDATNAALSGVSREQQLRIDDDAAAIASATDAALPAEPDWADDATMYVIYTSGSTGRPKGVVVPQNAVCNFLASMRREPGLLASDRLLAVTTLSFDIAVLELYLPLTVGARVVLAQREDAMDGEVLARMINDQDINVMQATPTRWHMLLDANWRAPTGFRALCGGEPLPPSLAKRMLEAGVELWNMYGPTETTVWSTLCHITDADQKITIGRPIANTQIWVLDEKLRPCPIGAEGELCIGGAGVAAGYFNHPELTAEKFISDPFERTPGARIYRTGDLARWRDDGTIEHLGRLDFQVKIRGYRIELGEIEARLAALPGVARTVVVAREDNPGDVRLVGYFVAQPDAQPDTAQLRESLRATLPDYMLPQHLVAMVTLPLLPNGKIDRNALPVPTEAGERRLHSVTALTTNTEQIIGDIWKRLLGIEQISASDNFFDLGGHSLAAMRVVSEVKQQVGVKLSVRRLIFETLSQIATSIDEELHTKATPAVATGWLSRLIDRR